jgi:nucleoside-diphosphate-sugar epimerase
MRVLIVGCGYVGTALGLRLSAQGHVVFGLRRNPAALPQGIRGVAADLLQPATLAGLPQELDSVVYAVGASGRTDAAYHDAYVVGLQHLLGALAPQSESLRRVLFVSSTAVYAQTDGEWVDETSPCDATHFSAQRLLEGEQALLRSGLPAVVLRLAGIYGPGRTSLLERVKSGVASYQSPPHYTNRIHQQDCAGAIEHLLAVPSPEPLYIGIDDEPVSEEVLLRWLAAQLGAPAPQVGDGAMPGRSSSNKRCSNQRLKASGYRFQFPTFREGYLQLMRNPLP